MVPPDIDIGVDAAEVSTKFPVGLGGKYLCTITTAKPDKSKEKNNDVLKVGFTPNEPIDCMVGDKTEKIGGRELFTKSYSFSEKARVYLKLLSEATGGTAWTGKRFRTEEILNKQVYVTVDVSEKDGVRRNNVLRVDKVS